MLRGIIFYISAYRISAVALDRSDQDVAAMVPMAVSPPTKSSESYCCECKYTKVPYRFPPYTFAKLNIIKSPFDV